MSQCIKTGACIFLAECGEWVITDLMETGDCYHFWIESADHLSRQKPFSRVNLIVYNSGGRKAGREVVTPKKLCGPFDYEGKLLAQGTDDCVLAEGGE